LHSFFFIQIGGADSGGGATVIDRQENVEPLNGAGSVITASLVDAVGSLPRYSRKFRDRVITRPSAAIAVLFVVVGAVASWARLPTVAQNTLWAEDIRDFLGDAVKYGPLPSLVRPYAGYLHTVPRIIAGLTAQFVPVSGWANAMAFGACIVTGIVGGLVFISSGTTIRWMPARILVASITFLVPLAPHEVLGNTANLHWYFLWLAPWLLLYRPSSRAVAWIMAIAALFAALTEIQMVLFIPLMLWQRSDRRRLPIRALYLVGASLQIVTTLFAPRNSSTAHLVDPLSLGYGYLINCVMTIASPDPAVLGPMLLAFGPTVGILMLVPFAALALYVVLRGSKMQRILAATLFVGSFALYAIAVEISPGTFYEYASMSKLQLAVPWIARYGVVPSAFLLALVPLALVVWRHHRLGALARSHSLPQPGAVPIAARLRLDRACLAVLCAVLLIMAASFVPASTRRADGPVWQPQVAQQEASCQNQSSSAQIVLHGAPLSRWNIYLTCAQLGR
jgi:hypothetical protein